MKKLLKKLLCLTLAVGLVLSLAACSEEKKEAPAATEQKETTEATPAPAPAPEDVSAKSASEAVKGVLDATLEGDKEKAANYVVDKAVLDDMAFASTDDMAEDLASSMGFTGKDAEMKEYSEKFRKIITDSISYEILSEEKNGDKYQVMVKMTAPDFDNLDDSEMMAGLEPLMNDLTENGTIKEGMTEQEVQDAMFEPIMDYMVEAIEKTVDKADKIEQEVEYTVIEKDGKFLVEKEIEE